ncbi:E3 ubiquitin-protein ligase DTX3L-like isoform X2 [Carassius carassius]|uniref:E3 ubiquitin-protein ligase DTX3L-like isoform X2 n=1 Tax=Carassius carassius TaxID=217509 RepID=UPI002868D3C5|nr:E3 ubiquitin-protein ligase DTX3L-like isoform X2 [Carassius carassius]
MQGSADQHMDVEQGSNYQQAPHSSSSVDHQMMQNGQVLHDQNLAASRAESQDSGSSLDERKHQDIPKDICRDGVESKTQSQPPAPEDIATFKIKLIGPTPFPAKWRQKLEKALQSWFIKLEKKREKRASVLSLTLMNDGCAEVKVTPSTALEALKKHTALSLNIKTENKEVAVQIFLDETHSVTVSQNSSEPSKNRISTSKVNRTQPVTSDDTNNGAEAAASNIVPSETKTAEKHPETSSELTVPLYQFWYLHHAYRKEVEKIEKQHGVSMHAEVSVSFKSTQRSSSDSVSKASEDFQKLVSECVESFSEAIINHNDIDSYAVKEARRNIRSEKRKMMFTMSASDCQFFGPKKFTDIIERETTRSENQFKNKSNEMDVDNICPQSRSSLVMDTKDLLTQLEMDKVHWDLIKLSYKEQLLQLETKYGVLFHEEKLEKNVFKVHAQSKGDQHIILESHALRALTHLYQKLASAAVSCELTKPTDQTAVAPIVEKLQQQNYSVVAANEFSPWKLVGLPEHLGPAIADIEKKLQKHVFDDKMKKLIGYSGDIPHARGIRWNQMPEYGPGAVGGAAGDEDVNSRGRAQTDSRFNKESEINAKHESKGAHVEEETCPICMDSFTDNEKLKCGHEFCRECIRMSVESLGPICPVCKEVFGKMEGNQPDGTMKVMKNRLSLPGYPDCGTIEIHYDIPSGIQMKKHPNPGQYFHGARRHAYLPDNREGQEVLSLLQRAFDQKLIFTVGTSTTSGLKNAVTWNDIHHKTNTHGGPLNYGYPDPDYLKRVKDELKAKGIE